MKKHIKNEEYELQITDIGTNGEGIGHLEDGYTLFVSGALPGDTVLARIVKAQKSYAFGRLQKIIEASPGRITASCPVADKCGGCQISNLCYEEQLRYKSNKVRELLLRVGGFEEALLDEVMNPIIGYSDKDYSITPERFRNKSQYPIGTDKDGNIIAGFYSAHSHRVVPTDDCLIGSAVDSMVLKTVIRYMNRFHIPAYDESLHKGLIRHVLIRTGYHTGEVMVCLVINGKSLPEKETLIESLINLDLEFGYRITTVCISSNTADTNVIMGDSFEVLYGPGYITDKIGGVSFRISPLSFFQVNPKQTEALYGTALDYAGLTGNETVWDLYCGIGTISLFLAQKAKLVYGVEIIPQAIDNARENAQINGFENVRFMVGKAEEVLPDFYTKAMESHENEEMLSPDVIVVDPPRKGCDGDCLDTMLRMQPQKIVYVSCDPATLARDLKILCESGKYRLSKVTPVDMFPNSVHIETACLLLRR